MAVKRKAASKAEGQSKAKKVSPKKADPVEEEEGGEQNEDDGQIALSSDSGSGSDISEAAQEALLAGLDSSDGEGEEDDRIIQLQNLAPSINSLLKTKPAAKTTGVLYIGRIPHGFYEQEMQSYFSQFGEIVQLRLSRSKKTGKSKHYAFIEFADREVAEIVARTMHNYLLSSSLLQVQLMTPEEVEAKGGREQLFKGAGRKFKVVPWAHIAKERVEKAKTKEQWEALQKKHEQRRKDKNAEMKAAGIDYSY
jgi:nucleolar protein 15